MKKRWRFIRRFIIVISIIFLIFPAWLLWFLIANDAPVIYGSVIWHEPYKEDFHTDIYLPTQIKFEKTPVVLYIHGGAWIGGNKATVNNNRFNGAFNSLRENGYAIVSPEYTLAKLDKPPFPDCIKDVSTALQWIKLNANEYNFDINNIGVFGESSGAQIAMMLAYPDDKVSFLTNNQPNINYVINVYGPTDLEKLYQLPLLDSLKNMIDRLPERLEKRLDITNYLFGFDPEKDTARRKEYMAFYSPVNYISNTAPATLIIHGEEDQLVPVEQSKTLKQKLDSVQVENKIHILINTNHAFRGATEQQKDSVQRWIVDFIKQKYR